MSNKVANTQPWKFEILKEASPTVLVVRGRIYNYFNQNLFGAK